MWKYFLTAFLAVLATCLSASAADFETVKVLCFNIRFSNPGDGPNYWELRKDFTMSVMKEKNYDFIGLQEVKIFPDAKRCQLRHVMEQLPEYGVIYRSREVAENDGESTPLFYRKDRWVLDHEEKGTFWLSDTPDQIGSNTWDAACRRVASWGRFTDKKNGTSLYVINTHFDHISKKAKEQSALLIGDFIAKRKHPGEPVILMGDFNSGEQSPQIKYLSGNTVSIGGKEQTPSGKLVDTYRAFKPDGKEEGTAHGFTGNPSTGKIDYIFASGNVKVINSRINRVKKVDTTTKTTSYPSDHFPVDAELSFPIESGLAH